MNRWIIISIIVFNIAVPSSFANKTMEYRAKVVRVVDGNTVVVSNKVFSDGMIWQGEFAVKLDSVEAPASDQLGGKESKIFLETIVKDKDVLIVELTDRGSSRGAWVFVGQAEQSVNFMLIAGGQAWLVDPTSIDAVSFGKPKQALDKMKQIYQTAKDRKLGIWAAANPIPPWEWRKQKQKQQE